MDNKEENRYGNHLQISPIKRKMEENLLNATDKIKFNGVSFNSQRKFNSLTANLFIYIYYLTRGASLIPAVM